MLKIFRKLYSLVSIVYFGLMIIVSLAPYWPHEYWWLANLIQISPMWIFCVILIFLLILGIAFNNKKIIIVHVFNFFVIFFFVLGYQIPLSLDTINADSSKTVKTATVDLGKTVNFEKVSSYIKDIDPDVVAFQETFEMHKPLLTRLFPPPHWDLAFEKELALASRIPILESELADRRYMGSSSVVAAEFVLQGDLNPIYFYNIWLESPRAGIEAIIDKKTGGFAAMKHTTELQETESFGVSQWTRGKFPVLVAGDFNHLASSPIHREHWSHLGNAFSDVGLGFGYTKYTRVHGVRLDHFLYSPEWQAIKATVGPDLEADHRPVQVDFVFTKGVLRRKTSQHKTRELFSQKDDKIYLINEDFADKDSLELFVSNHVKKPELYKRNSHSPPASLLISIPADSVEYSAGLTLDIWHIERFPKLSFAYRISPDAPVTLRVKTRFNQWVCIASTLAVACPELKGVSISVLNNDDGWHEFTLDVNKFMKSVLPGIKTLHGFEFHFPLNRHSGDLILVDDFRIFENK